MYNCSRYLLSSCLSRVAIQRIGGAVCNSSSLSSKFQSLSLNNYIKPTTTFTYKPLGFSANTSFRFFSKSSKKPARTRSSSRRFNVEKDDKDKPKKLSSAAKRARQSAKRRLYNRAQKSLVRIRAKKVLESLKFLEQRTNAQPDEVVATEKLIREAHSVIDKAVKVGTLHRKTGARRKSRLARRKKTGARRKSRLARRKKAVEIHHGWHRPSPEITA